MIARFLANPALRSRDFRYLWAGAGCNSIGQSGEQVILGLLVYQITQSTAWVGVVLAMNLLPMLLFGLLSGAVADWLDRRVLLRCVEVAIGLNLIVFAGLAAAGMVGLWPLLVFALVSGALRSMSQPVRTSYAYDIVGHDHVVAGLGLLNLGTRAGQLVGALIAGAMLERFGTPAAFLVLAAGHAMAFLWYSGLRSAGLMTGVERAPIRKNLGEYITEMKRNRTLLMLLAVTAAVEVCGFSFSTALPEIATDRFGLGAEGLGAMHAARAGGGMLASIALAGMSGLRRRGTLFLVVIYAFGASLLLLAAATNFVVALIAAVAIAGLATASDILTQSMVQLSVPNEFRGRAMGAWMLAIGSAPFGHLEMGALAVTLGVGGALAINGAALIGIGVLATIAAPGLRKL